MVAQVEVTVQEIVFALKASCVTTKDLGASPGRGFLCGFADQLGCTPEELARRFPDLLSSLVTGIVRVENDLALEGLVTNIAREALAPVYQAAKERDRLLNSFTYRLYRAISRFVPRRLW
jgi:hypothetical protein